MTRTVSTAQISIRWLIDGLARGVGPIHYFATWLIQNWSLKISVNLGGHTALTRRLWATVTVHMVLHLTLNLDFFITSSSCFWHKETFMKALLGLSLQFSPFRYFTLHTANQVNHYCTLIGPRSITRWRWNWLTISERFQCIFRFSLDSTKLYIFLDSFESFCIILEDCLF